MAQSDPYSVTFAVVKPRLDAQRNLNARFIASEIQRNDLPYVPV
jgi:hypothetical protein